jgi:hypothetical protein
MMLYKQRNPSAFAFLDRIGMRVSTFSEVYEKRGLGMCMGLTNLVQVLFGLFAVKLVNIPL